MIFLVAFLGSLFAILVSLLLVYTYVMLRVLPRIKRGFVDPALIQMRMPPAFDQGAGIIAFTCEDHGRCVGCPKVLAQFDAIVRHQGALDEIEQAAYDDLCAKLKVAA